MRRLLAALASAGVLLVATAAIASAHPLGNYTVNRAVVVTVTPDQVAIRYLIDMAEIPAFNEIAAVDANADGTTAPAEQDAYAAKTCLLAGANLELSLDMRPAEVRTGELPAISFPEGAGGLHTLRLECSFVSDLPAGSTGTLVVADTNDDGHVGWHEVIVTAAGGARITASDSPATSDSAYLTAYPADRLQTPPDVRRGRASFEATGGTDGLSAAPAAPGVAPTANDPLAALIGGELSPALVALALLLAAGLGAAHALSPGHGKTLVAAYLVGSRGTVRQAVALGLTVAATHTIGVLVLGVLVLVGGEVFLPERLIGWLTVISGGVMATLGGALVWRAIRRRQWPQDEHAHHEHAHHEHPQHVHPHPHPHGHGARPALTVRSVAVLGVAGGMVPSASALIVLLAAVTTGRLVFGLALIAAFGVGMAVILGGIAAATTVAHGWLSDRLDGGLPRLASRIGGLVPLGAGIVVAGVGLILTVAAVARLG